MNLTRNIAIIALILIFVYFLSICKRKETNIKVARLGVLLSLSLIFGIIDSFIPSFFPGARLGLANLIILLDLYLYGYKDAFLIDIGKVILISLIRGNFLSMGNMMSLAGSMLSYLAMSIFLLIFKKKISVITISIIGAIFHNLGQVLIGYVYIGNLSVFYYLPILEALGIATGLLTGVLSKLILNRYSFLFK